MTKSQVVRTGIVDPNRDAAGLAGLLALSSVAGTDLRGQQKAVGALRALAAASSSIREDLLQKFPRAADADDIASSLGAAPLSEEDVIEYNTEKPPVNLAALYLEPTPPALDYPYAVMPEVDPQTSAAATGLRQVLRKPAFKNALAAAGSARPGRYRGQRLRGAGRCPGRVRAGHRARGRRQGRRDRRHGRRRSGRQRDQPDAGPVGRHHGARPGARGVRRLRLDADQGAHRRRPDPRPGHSAGAAQGPGAVRRQVVSRHCGCSPRTWYGRKPCEGDRADQPALVGADPAAGSRSGASCRSATATPACTTPHWPRTRRCRTAGRLAGSTR